MYEQHSFGGSHLDRYLYEFDPDETGDAAGAPAAVAEPGLEAGVDASLTDDLDAADESPGALSSAPAEAAAPTWTPDDPQFRTAVEQTVEQRIAELVREAEWEAQQAGGEQAAPAFEFDPFSDNPGEQLANIVASVIQQERSKSEQEQQANTWAEGVVGATIGKLKQELGEFDEDGVTRLAAGFMERLPDGSPPWALQRAADQALRQSAEYLTGLVKTEREAAVEAYKQSINPTGPGTQSDTGVSGAGLETVSAAKSYDEIISRHVQRARTGEAALRGGHTV